MGTPLSLDEVENIAPYIQYVATGGQTVFPYPFPITQDSDLVLEINGIAQATDSGYTLSGQGNDTGGNLTLTSGATAGVVYTLYRDIPIQRITQFTQNGQFSSQNLNDEFNNLYLISQQIAQSLAGGNQSTALMVPNSNNPTPTTVLTPAFYANKFLAFDSNGNPIASPGTVSVVPGVYAQVYNVVTYGADPSGVLESTAAIGLAIVAANAAGGGVVYFPSGNYLVGLTSQIAYPYGNINLKGASRDSVNIYNASTSHPAFAIGSASQTFGGGIASMSFTGKVGVVGVNGQAAFTVQQNGHFNVRDVHVGSYGASLYRGVYFTNVSQFNVYNLQVEGCLNDGITNLGGTDAYFTDSRSDANTGAGWTLNAAQGGYYKGCTAFNNTANGWNLNSGAPASFPNKNNFFVSCVGDTSGSYNWNIGDCQDSSFTGCWGSSQQSLTVNTFATGFIVYTQYCQRLIFTACRAITNNSHGFQIDDTGSSAPTNIVISDCQGTLNGAAAGGGYGLTMNGSTNHIRVNGGLYLTNATGSILNQSGAADVIISGSPVGFVGRNVGSTGAISTGATVTHGLAGTPVFISLTLVGTSPSGVEFSASAIGTSTFTINFSGGGTQTFLWSAQLAICP